MEPAGLIAELQRQFSEACAVATGAYRNFGYRSREFDEAALKSAALSRQIKELRRLQNNRPASQPKVVALESLAAEYDDESALARRIRAYWGERGHQIETRVLIEAGLPCVRSNLIAGLPRAEA